MDAIERVRREIALAREHLNDDPRFSSNAVRIENRVVLAETLSEIFRRHSTAHWLDEFENAGVPAGPVLSVTEMHADPQALAREMIVATDHPVAGNVKTIGHPVKFSETPGGVTRAAPLMGQHTAEVLRELGYSEEEISSMAKSGTIMLSDEPAPGR